MICSRCKAENPDTGKFCNECGERLAASAARGRPDGTLLDDGPGSLAVLLATSLMTVAGDERHAWRHRRALWAPAWANRRRTERVVTANATGGMPASGRTSGLP